MQRSYLLQKLLNYFPDTDPRMREGQSTLDAQLLNVAACSLEESEQRLNRELDGRLLATAPANSDNSGVYYRTVTPPEIPIQNPTVRGKLASGWVTLQPYDDLLPVPTRLVVDETRAPVYCTNPAAFEATGDGLVESATIGPLPFPNYLTFEIEGLPTSFNDVVEVLLEGEAYPKPVSLRPGPPQSERVYFTDEGTKRSIFPWSELTRVTVRSLPAGAKLKAYLIPCQISKHRDQDRPVIHPAYRGIAYDRYWTIQGLLLKESFQTNRLAGLETVCSYWCPERLNSIAIEPNTQGMWASSGTKLYYLDRREPMPSLLDRTGITEEPLYNLLAWADPAAEEDSRAVILQPLENSQSSNVVKWRLLVQTPGSDTMFVVVANSSLAPYSSNSGWRQDVPKPVTLPLTVPGTYLFTLETSSKQGHVTRDVCAHLNAALPIKAQFDLSTLLPEIQGVFFDAFQRLWVWTGQQVVPLKPSYDAYLLDPNTRSIYTTDPYEVLHVA